MEGNLRVFIIDDDYISNIITENILQRVNTPEKIHIYQDPREALAFIKETYTTSSAPLYQDLIFLDVLMPLMDGDEFVAELEKIPAIVPANTSVVLLTGSEYPYHTKKFEQFPTIKASLIKPLTEEAIGLILEKLYGIDGKTS